MQTSEILKIIALVQGGFFLGVLVVVLDYSFRRDVPRKMKWYSAGFMTSYTLLVIGTLMSLYREKYALWDVWYFIVGAGYVSGNISLLIIVFLHIQQNKKSNNEKVHN